MLNEFIKLIFAIVENKMVSEVYAHTLRTMVGKLLAVKSFLVIRTFTPLLNNDRV